LKEEIINDKKKHLAISFVESKRVRNTKNTKPITDINTYNPTNPSQTPVTT
jgi:hypothetical protein